MRGNATSGNINEDPAAINIENDDEQSRVLLTTSVNLETKAHLSGNISTSE
jgi:hypothetical protein